MKNIRSISFIEINWSDNLLHFFLFQTLNNISAEKNSTIIFPLPIDLVTHFMKEKKAWSA